MIPTLKKKASAFLLNEEGKISKDALFKIGTFVAVLGLSSVLGSKFADADKTKHANGAHCNNCGHTYHQSHDHGDYCNHHDTHKSGGEAQSREVINRDYDPSKDTASGSHDHCDAGTCHSSGHHNC